MSFPLVVLAAGLSKRYGRLKQLEPLGPQGEAIMDYNVFDALRAGFGDVIYVVRPEILDDVRDHVAGVFGDSLSTRFVLQELTRLPDGFRAPPDRSKPWGTAQAVLCAAEELAGPFVVCNADDLYGPAAFQRLHDFLADDGDADGALIGYPLRDTLAGGGGALHARRHRALRCRRDHAGHRRDGILPDLRPARDLDGHRRVPPVPRTRPFQGGRAAPAGSTRTGRRFRVCDASTVPQETAPSRTQRLDLASRPCPCNTILAR